MAALAHEVMLDIVPVANRPCRPFQERIAEYALDGRPRFEWESMRHRFILQGDPTILHVCTPCPLNVFTGPEGCKGRVDGLETFVRAVGRICPDSSWVSLPLDGSLVDLALARQLHAEVPALEEAFATYAWPAARVFRDGQPLEEELPDGSSRPVYFAWNGEGPPSLVASNDGYQIYMSAHGLIVKATYEDPVPATFRKLWREERAVYGLTTDGQTIGFQMSLARLPEWDPQLPQGSRGELVMGEMPAATVFRDPLDIMEIYVGLALDADTGFWIKPL